MRICLLLGMLPLIFAGCSSEKKAVDNSKKNDSIHIAISELKIRDSITDNIQLMQAILENEKRIITYIKSYGTENRLVITEIMPDSSISGSLSINTEDGGLTKAKTEFPGDKLLVSGVGGISGAVLSASGEQIVFNPFSRTDSTIHANPSIPAGDGSIHRYSGGCYLMNSAPNYLIYGDSSISQRLTFALIKNVGYVSIRGFGIIKSESGNSITLVRGKIAFVSKS